MPATIPAALRQPLANLLACLRFYSRLPLPAFAFESAPYAMLDFSRVALTLPVAGACLGALGAAAFALAIGLGLPATIAATLAVAALVLATGAMQEDGLADVADGFGGGRDRARKLEIMKDSRIGAFGAAALILAVLLRVQALATLGQRGVGLAALALIGAGALSRMLGLLPLTLLAPARAQGAGAAAGAPSWPSFARGALVAGLVALAPTLAGASGRQAGLAVLASAAAAYGVTRLARWQIGGQTGDVAGAAQQAAEIAFLITLCAG